ncbi:PQQ-dependent sugar dehydrogenase [uncultured Erythrobacter sp.]|uniref:PQQ-dependent sugar dehydrogenase n=1 Tax=uncultured Erythrobacter sp. TaxID=263913 RepID=UPI0026034F22|nr:PQQ-dependent sugar dehydrogenase [uncultured Erythrobacter sp.]
MKNFSKASITLSISAVALASCANADAGDSAASAEAGEPDYTVSEMGEFNEPWAIEFAPGTGMLFVTEKSGTLKLMNTASGSVTEVSGAPTVAYGGQGGLGDVAFLESEAEMPMDGRTIYLSWAEGGDGGNYGAAVGRGKLSCDEAGEDCAITDLGVVWRQSIKTGKRGHYSHRILFSPDEQHMFIASGDRQELDPAQDNTNNLGTIVRLNLDGTPAEGNPMADQGDVESQIWSYGHRNILGMDWDADGRLWDIEHGPAGGDELNLVQSGANYGWPTRSYGNHYNGDPIEDHSEDDGFVKPAAHWTPVIAPGDMIIYSGDMFGPWKGDALIAGLSSEALVRVDIDGEIATEAARYEVGGRLRSVEQGPDGSIWVAEDGDGGRVLKLSI